LRFRIQLRACRGSRFFFNVLLICSNPFLGILRCKSSKLFVAVKKIIQNKKSIMEENKKAVEPEAAQDWKDKLEEKVEEVKDKAEEVWDKVEDKAEEVFAAAKDKAEDLADGAKNIWNKLVDKFDGDEPAEKK
jgi:hypothetical protein